jgi:hypothetical protein
MPVSAALERILPGLSETASINTFNAIAHQWLGHIVPIEVQSIEELDEAREPSSLLCSKIPVLRPQPGFMTTPWKYTGQSVPRAKQAVGAAALVARWRVREETTPRGTHEPAAYPQPACKDSQRHGRLRRHRAQVLP